jgi:hypothetical protein
VRYDKIESAYVEALEGGTVGSKQASLDHLIDCLEALPKVGWHARNVPTKAERNLLVFGSTQLETNSGCDSIGVWDQPGNVDVEVMM